MSKRRARSSAELKQDAVSRMGQGGQTVTALLSVPTWQSCGDHFRSHPTRSLVGVSGQVIPPPDKCRVNPD